jgi:hypothetical protein
MWGSPGGGMNCPGRLFYYPLEKREMAGAAGDLSF